MVLDNLEPERRYGRRTRGRRNKTQTFKILPQSDIPINLRSDISTFLPRGSTEIEVYSDYSDESLQTTPEQNRLTQTSVEFHDHSKSLPSTPAMRPLLTARADAPMLGAQARAAELAAASAAKQRQATRDLEDEQTLPITTVPLSAYTKSQHTANRNKGNKAWKPLVLDNIDEGTDDLSTPAATVATPQQPGRMTGREISDKRVPSAPRAMVASREKKPLPGVAAQPKQSNIESTMTLSWEPRKLFPTLEPVKKISTKPQVPKPNTLSHPPFQGFTPSNDFNHFSFHEGSMFPDDTSPAKQEEKFHMLGGRFMVQTAHEPDQSHDYLSPIYPQDEYAPRDNVRQDQHAQRYQWDEYRHDTVNQGYEMPWQGVSPQIPSSYDHDGTYDYSGAFTGQLEDSAHRYVQQPAYGTASVPLSRREMRRSSLHFVPRNGFRLLVEPYDTERAMKDCVDRLREQAKDGKTVLSNPENRKDSQQNPASIVHGTKGWEDSDERIFSRPVPWEVQSMEEASKNPKPAASAPLCLPITAGNNTPVDHVSVLKPAPGLPSPKAFGHLIPLLDSNQAGRRDDAAPVGSEAWMRLTPISLKERTRVRNCLTMAPSTVPCPKGHEKAAESGTKDDVTSLSKEWFHNDARGEQDLREQVEILAKDHAAQAVSNSKARNRGSLPKDFANGKDDSYAANLILGNVACNLQTYLVGDPRSVEQRQNFHKVKAVPDWCAENGATSPVHGFGESFFDGIAGGFIGAPVRVARDPRFRPQLKEGIKPKADEEWKNRHEMYGRRMM